VVPRGTTLGQHRAMVEAARARAGREGIARLVAALLAALMVLTSEAALLPIEAEARGGRSQASAIRRHQVSAERSMRRADRQVRRLERRLSQRQRGFAHASRQLDRAIARRERAQRQAERTRRSLVTARVVRDRTLRVRPAPSGRQVVDLPALRKRVDRLGRRLERQARRSARADRQVQRTRQAKQRQVRRGPVARLVARREARERAETRLGSQISLMLALAKERARDRFGGRHERGFRQPAKGTISQGYGCQRVGRGKHRKRCAGFHDGIDIATRRGAPVRAAAAGYVAYVGWNPWDPGRRAFVVIIGHARGFETVYGHLRPTRRVRAGERVRRGQVIGVVGLTGRTSGAHVHWEVSKGFRTLDPRRAGR
jgi:murein DD-endopeptidase MepM/ murein hydrolase activator NlpD